LNYYRIGNGNGGVYHSDDGTDFANLNTDLLVGAENEFAILFDEYVGNFFISGWHGYESVVYKTETL
jgi:hypothetical protein